MTFPSHTAAIHGRIRLLTQLSLLAQLYQVSGQATGCLPGEVIQEGQGLSWVPSCPSRAAGGEKRAAWPFLLASENQQKGMELLGLIPSQSSISLPRSYCMASSVSSLLLQQADSQPSLSPCHSP